MDFKITNSNIDDWCFRHLENDLSADERRFFDQALEFDSNIRNEYAKWDNTILTSIDNIYVSPSLTSKILDARKIIPWQKILFIATLAIGIISISFNIYNVSKETPLQEIEVLSNEKSTTVIIQNDSSTVKQKGVIHENKNFMSKLKNHTIEESPKIEVVDKDSTTIDILPNLTKNINKEVKKDTIVTKPTNIKTTPVKINPHKKKKKKRKKRIIPISDNL